MGCEQSIFFNEFQYLDKLNELIPQINLNLEHPTVLEEKLSKLIDKNLFNDPKELTIEREEFDNETFKKLFYILDTTTLSNELHMFSLMTTKWSKDNVCSIDNFIINLFPFLDHCLTTYSNDNQNLTNCEEIKNMKLKQLLKKRSLIVSNKEEKLLNIIENSLHIKKTDINSNVIIPFNQFDIVIIDLLINHSIFISKLFLRNLENSDSIIANEKNNISKIIEDYFSIDHILDLYNNLIASFKQNKVDKVFTKEDVIAFFKENQFLFKSETIRLKILEYVNERREAKRD